VQSDPVGNGRPDRHLHAKSCRPSCIPPGYIWYLALADKLRPKARFAEAAAATAGVAIERHGAGSLEVQAVRRAWAQVGVGVEDVAPMG
jgi:Thermolysin metallopeptidase, alpha-helical domain